MQVLAMATAAEAAPHLKGPTGGLAAEVARAERDGAEVLVAAPYRRSVRVAVRRGSVTLNIRLSAETGALVVAELQTGGEGGERTRSAEVVLRMLQQWL